MKYISIIIIVCAFLSCKTKKQVSENTIKKTDKIAMVTEKPKTIMAVEEKKEMVVTKESSITTPSVEEEKVATTLKETLNEVATKNIVEPVIESVQPVETTKTMSTAKKEIFNHDIWHNLLQKHVSTQGNVNYKGFKSNRATLKKYITNLSNNLPDATWTKEEKLAYWINAYNALTVDLILRNYPLQSIKDIKDPWGQRFWKLGEKWYDLNEIEHEILRKMDEPRIHFAIVCASFSCPKLINKAFIAKNLETQLTKATKDFLADSARNNLSKNDIKLSKIFKWFAKDFKTNGSLIDFLNTYASITIASNAKKSFKDYNWSLNE